MQPHNSYCFICWPHRDAGTGAAGLQNPMVWAPSIPVRRIITIALWLIVASGCCAQDSPAEIHRDYDLSRLELSPEHRSQVEAALQQKDYKTAERILVQEAELDPKSPRAANCWSSRVGCSFSMLNTAIQ